MKYFSLLAIIFSSTVALSQSPIIGGSSGPTFIAPAIMKKLNSKPSPPSAGYSKLYFNNNEKLYRLQSDGTEVLIDLSGNAKTASAFDHYPSGCVSNSFASSIDTGGNLSCSKPSISLLSQVFDVLPILSGGTNNPALDTTAGGVLTTDGTKIISTGPGVAGQILQSSGSSAAFAFPLPPTVSRATAGGVGTGGFATITAQQGWLIDITAGLSTALTSGATYTNNGNSYTSLVSLASGTTGQVLFVSGSGVTSGTTLTLTSASGTGPTTITISQTTPLSPLALYLFTTPTTPRTPLYLEVEMVGSGGGGGGGNVSGGNSGSGSFFGISLLIASPGAAGGLTNAGPSAGGGFTVNSPAIDMGSVIGGDGTSGCTTGGQFPAAGGGGTSFLGGSGGGSVNNGTGSAGKANTGSGGGGGCTGNNFCAGGGAASGTVRALIPNPSATYYYTIGVAGAAVSTGGAGASGGITIKAGYQ